MAPSFDIARAARIINILDDINLSDDIGELSGQIPDLTIDAGETIPFTYIRKMIPIIGPRLFGNKLSATHELRLNDLNEPLFVHDQVLQVQCLRFWKVVTVKPSRRQVMPVMFMNIPHDHIEAFLVLLWWLYMNDALKLDAVLKDKVTHKGDEFLLQFAQNCSLLGVVNLEVIALVKNLVGVHTI
jgi:hypothetical protein